MATIENTITPDSTLEKTNKRISGFDINSTLHEATQNKFKLCNGEEKDNDTILHFTKDNFVTLNGRLYGMGGGFYYLNPLYEKMNNGAKLTNETDGDNFVITYGFNGKLTHVYYTTSDNKTVFIDTLKKSNNEIFQIKTTNDGIRYYRTISSTASTNTPWEIESYQRIHKELGNFGTEQEALDALAKVEICGNKDIVHIHLIYGSYATIICLQSIEANYCRQIIYNKTKMLQRAIYFADSNRTQISYKEDWSFLFGDRLKWDCSKNKYLLSQFEGPNFNDVCTNPIPTANDEHDGLMSKSDKVKLDTLSTPSIVTSSKNGLMPYTLYKNIYQACTSSNPGYMTSDHYRKLDDAYAMASNALSSIQPLENTLSTLSAKVNFVSELVSNSIQPELSSIVQRVDYIESSKVPYFDKAIQKTLAPLVTTVGNIEGDYVGKGDFDLVKNQTTNLVNNYNNLNTGYTHLFTAYNALYNYTTNQIGYINNWILGLHTVQNSTNTLIPVNPGASTGSTSSNVASTEMKLQLEIGTVSPNFYKPKCGNNLDAQTTKPLDYSKIVMNKTIMNIWHNDKMIYNFGTYNTKEKYFECDLLSYKDGMSFTGYCYIGNQLLLSSSSSGISEALNKSEYEGKIYVSYLTNTNEQYGSMHYPWTNDTNRNYRLGNAAISGQNGGYPIDGHSWQLCLGSKMYNEITNSTLNPSSDINNARSIVQNITYMQTSDLTITPSNTNKATFTEVELPINEIIKDGVYWRKYKMNIPKNSGLTKITCYAYSGISTINIRPIMSKENIKSCLNNLG